MPVVIECPSCRRRIRMSEHMIGRHVKCPGCAHPFTATLSGGEPAPVAEQPAANAAAAAVPEAPPRDGASAPPGEVPVAGPPAAPSAVPPHPEVAPPMPPKAPTDGATPPPAPQSEALVQYLLFHRMITPLLLQIMFWLGVVISIFLGAALMVSGLVAASTIDWTRIGLGAALVLLGPCAFRLACELGILLFRIYEMLTAICQRLPATPPFPPPPKDGNAAS
ncbi:MAG: DUF4282 domain-containing protein [Gemmataceae bacterium]|nr:DUF4282 domain-containing protein [Gemmataceae bacterium]MDW8265624.1 DUF4282 domain-containing protein [Gemmataceae bacterium]